MSALRGGAWLVLLIAAGPAMGASYTVCATGCTAANLASLFSSRNLAGGDTVTVSAGTYGAVSVPAGDGGEPGNPVRVIGVMDDFGNRPRLQGGTNTLAFDTSNHVLFDGFDISGGTGTCVFVHAHDITLRNSVIHGCPAHGILGADQDSGSFTLEYSEVFDTGSGTQKHALYLQSDETAFPGAVARIRHNYIHGGNGGNLIKVRHERVEIHYNWIEGALYQELELIGPDVETQSAGWDEDDAREDADVVGNVILHTSSWRNAIRMGGDLNGRSKGRVRLLNNTIVFDAPVTNARAVLVQLGAQSLEMHNNAVYQLGNARAGVVAELVVDDTPPWGDRNPWIAGRQVSGSNNWIEQSSPSIPPEFTGTRIGLDPMFGGGALYDFMPLPGPLIDGGNASPSSAPGFEFPSPLPRAAFMPQRRLVAPGTELARPVVAGVDIGAFEAGTDTRLFRNGFE